MKLTVTLLFVFIGIYTSESSANCSGNSRMSPSQITNNFTGAIVCAVPGSDAATVGADGPWHERHNSDGTIDEMHSNTPADPIEPGIATWVVSGPNNGPGVITYNYTGGVTISYTIKNQGASYSFCTPGTTNEIATATLNTCP